VPATLEFKQARDIPGERSYRARRAERVIDFVVRLIVDDVHPNCTGSTRFDRRHCEAPDLTTGAAELRCQAVPNGALRSAV
jgi:hypothetical protein